MSLLEFNYKELPHAIIKPDPDAEGCDYCIELKPWKNAGLQGVHIHQQSDHISITIEEAKALVEYLSLAITTAEEAQ